MPPDSARGELWILASQTQTEVDVSQVKSSPRTASVYVLCLLKEKVYVSLKEALPVEECYKRS